MSLYLCLVCVWCVCVFSPYAVLELTLQSFNLHPHMLGLQVCTTTHSHKLSLKARNSVSWCIYNSFQLLCLISSSAAAKDRVLGIYV